MKKEKALKITAIVWIMVSLTILANATTISNTITSFTGTVSVTPTDNSNALTVTNAGTGSSLFIDHNGASGVGILIDSEITNAGNGIEIYMDNTQSQRALYARTNNPAWAGEGLVHLETTTASSGNILKLENAGTGNGLFIDQNGNGAAILIDTEATTEPFLKLTGTTNGGCGTGDYGLYQNATDLSYCKNGVGIKIA